MKNNTKKNILEKTLLKYLIKQKVCVGEPVNITDPSQYSFLLGRRSHLFTVLNPKNLIINLRAFFYFLKHINKTKGRVCFILNFNESLILNKLTKTCSSGSHFCFNQNIKLNNLFSENKPKAIIALFLDSPRLNVLYTEANILEVPVICFTTQVNNFFSSNLQILGAFNTQASKNLLISLIILALKEK